MRNSTNIDTGTGVQITQVQETENRTRLTFRSERGCKLLYLPDLVMTEPEFQALRKLLFPLGPVYVLDADGFPIRISPDLDEVSRFAAALPHDEAFEYQKELNVNHPNFVDDRKVERLTISAFHPAPVASSAWVAREYGEESVDTKIDVTIKRKDVEELQELVNRFLQEH